MLKHDQKLRKLWKNATKHAKMDKDEIETLDGRYNSTKEFYRAFSEKIQRDVKKLPQNISRLDKKLLVSKG